MNREEISKKTMEKYQITDDGLQKAFPDFAAVKNRLLYGEIWGDEKLDIRQRFLITTAVLTTVEGNGLKGILDAALKNGVKASELKEVFHQAAPYTGFLKAEKGLEALSEACRDNGIGLPIEDNRLEEGIAVQKSVFGEIIDAMRENAPKGQEEMQDYLSAFCFGDTYTRHGLDLKTRELLTFVCLLALGGCESQLHAHIGGNLAVGNSWDLLIGAVYQCLPYVGFPRSLNAVTAINNVVNQAAEKNKN